MKGSLMTHPAGESNDASLRVDLDRRLLLQFRGSVVTTDAGLLAYRELDDALGLSAMAGDVLTNARTGKNGRHALVGMLRQSVFGRLAEAKTLLKSQPQIWDIVADGEQPRFSDSFA